MRDNLSELVHKWTGGMFLLRSGYYAGRPPSEGDLGSKHLEMLYQGIKSDVGGEEATNFARFVNKLNDLSASAFIVAFEQFWAHDCKTIDISQTAADGMRLDARGSALEAQGFGAIMSRMAGGVDDGERQRRSGEVKAQFIQDHYDEIPEDERREHAGGFRRFG